ncbi:hypothetical protein PISMIDRAFT_689072 [Pisolithus microcarpus 441]|uniref:Uncharacterized protein n=1 Tax=Pisolithus microcarpus 441 TaxID=765257 RepID=A0A0C9Y7W8_9AGAM|nr:hypothetical protein PISMIDRAFT_689072 [Pisolithus microcarpus 441]
MRLSERLHLESVSKGGSILIWGSRSVWDLEATGGLEGGSQLILGDRERDPTTQNGLKTRGEVPGSKAVAEGEDGSVLTKNH